MNDTTLLAENCRLHRLLTNRYTILEEEEEEAMPDTNINDGFEEEVLYEQELKVNHNENNHDDEIEFLKKEVREVHFAHLALQSDSEAPKTYEEAMTSSQKDSWKEAMGNEITTIENNGVWEVYKEKLPKGKKPLKMRWVYTIKEDLDENLFAKARCVVKGYTQIAGVDYTESHAPVIQETTFRVVITIGLRHGYTTITLDVEGAFQHGDLEEEVFVEPPPGSGYEHGTVLQLKKALYGLVQAARSWYIKFGKLLKSLGLHQSISDPCMFVKDLDLSLIHI